MMPASEHGDVVMVLPSEHSLPQFVISEERKDVPRGKKEKIGKRKLEKSGEDEAEELKKLRRLKLKVELFKMKLECLKMSGKKIDSLEPEDQEVREFFLNQNEE